MEKTKFTVADEKVIRLAPLSEKDNVNEWLGNVQWVLRTVKKEVYDKTQEFVDYLFISYDMLPVFTSLYKIEHGTPAGKVPTYHCGSFTPSDNNYDIDLFVSLDLEPGTVGIGISSRINEKTDDLFSDLSKGIEFVCRLVRQYKFEPEQSAEE